VAADEPASTGGKVAQNEACRIASLTAQTQQILIQAQRQIQFAAERVANLGEF
jgi:hypothetical protein